MRPHITPVVRWVQNCPQTVKSRASLLPLRFKAFSQVPRCRTQISNSSTMPLRVKIWTLKTRHGRQLYARVPAADVVSWPRCPCCDGDLCLSWCLRRRVECFCCLKCGYGPDYNTGPWALCVDDPSHIQGIPHWFLCQRPPAGLSMAVGAAHIVCG